LRTRRPTGLSGLPRDARLLPPSTTSMGSLGARFWGQVRGFAGRLRTLRGKGAANEKTKRIAGKPHYQALFPDHIAAGRSLHGKEGVDGSSPSEGFDTKSLQIGKLCCLHWRARNHAGTRTGTRFGTGGHSWASATSGVASRHASSQGRSWAIQTISLHMGIRRCLARQEHDTLPGGKGSTRAAGTGLSRRRSRVRVRSLPSLHIAFQQFSIRAPREGRRMSDAPQRRDGRDTPARTAGLRSARRAR
jgi:hypothetical protein